jgi:hypothetical protein
MVRRIEANVHFRRLLSSAHCSVFASLILIRICLSLGRAAGLRVDCRDPDWTWDIISGIHPERNLVKRIPFLQPTKSASPPGSSDFPRNQHRDGITTMQKRRKHLLLVLLVIGLLFVSTSLYLRQDGVRSNRIGLSPAANLASLAKIAPGTSSGAPCQTRRL